MLVQFYVKNVSEFQRVKFSTSDMFLQLYMWIPACQPKLEFANLCHYSKLS